MKIIHNIEDKDKLSNIDPDHIYLSFVDNSDLHKLIY